MLELFDLTTGKFKTLHDSLIQVADSIFIFPRKLENMVWVQD